MGMDITMNAPPTAAEIAKAGLDKAEPDYYRFNWGGMHVMVMAMVAAGALAEDDVAAKVPWPPPGAPKDRVAALEEAFRDPTREADLTPAERTQLTASRAAMTKMLSRHSAHKGKVPAYKFQSNEGWLVAADECTTIATKLRAYGKRATQRDLDRLGKAYQEAQAALTASLHQPGEVAIAGTEGLGLSLEEFRSWTAEWAAYNEVAARHGGYHVD